MDTPASFEAACGQIHYGFRDFASGRGALSRLGEPQIDDGFRVEPEKMGYVVRIRTVPRAWISL
jgi:hypothetical protein